MSVVKLIIQDIKRFSHFLGLYFKNKRSLEFLLKDLGWFSDISDSDVTVIDSFYNIESLIEQIDQLVKTIINTQNFNETTLGNVRNLITSLYGIFETTNLSIFPFNQVAFRNQIKDDLIDYFIANYLKNVYPRFYSICLLLKIIKEEFTDVNSVPNRCDYYKYTINIDGLFNLITKPVDFLKEEYNWQEATINPKLMLDDIQKSLAYFNVNPKYDFPSQAVVDNYYTLTYLENNPVQGMDLNVFEIKRDTSAGGFLKLGINITPVPFIPYSGMPNGFLISPFALGVVAGEFPLTSDTALVLEGSLSIQDVIWILIHPQKSKIIINDPQIQLSGKMGWKYVPEKPMYLFGGAGETRFEINSAYAELSVNGIFDDPELILKLGTGEDNNSSMKLVVQTTSSDSFIKKIIGDKPLELTLGGYIGWSSKKGMMINGNAGFSIQIPINLDLKFIVIKDLTIHARLNQEGIAVDFGVGFIVDTSCLVISIENIGVSLTGTDKRNAGNKGLLNNLDFDFDFKFPDGVALAINAGPVKGAGFLDYKAATSTYTGGLELTFSKISFSAIGIISTKLPGGKEGYSLLIIITAEFSPIQLGMGFTLTGLGGLLGLNRTMNPDVLRTGLRDKTLDSILFPKDIINNKDTIISNIGQAFPVMEGQFMVGPMAKIGWGTPTLITIELGIILEFPEPVRLAILGVLRAILPSEDKSVLKLQINFLGIIDFTAKYLSFDASIYDSKILTFPLMGDMALRLYWGDKPNFLMSVGGFHPRYTPPPLNLPELRRLSLVLASDKNLSIGIEAYFAITSNSVQFGAKVAAKAILLKGKVEVLGALWFDILFQFSPFYFVADMGVLFSIRWKGKELLTLFINLMLEGPNPWRAQGKGTFKILGIGISVSFDKTFGQTRTETIAPVALDTKFSEVLSHKDNWEALLPERSHQQVSWKDAADSTELIVDSGGQLRFSQRLLPLNIDLSKYGTAPISDTRKFKIQGVTAGQDGIPGSPTPMDTEKVFDLFARNEFFNMTDDEKLSKDPYEPFESGVLIGSDALSAEYAVHRKIDYENIVLDAGYRKRNPKWDLSAALMNVHLMDSYVSASALSDFVAVSDHGGPSKVAVSRAEETFVVINRENMGMATATHFASSADADAFLVQARASNAGASEWYVANSYELA